MLNERAGVPGADCSEERDLHRCQEEIRRLTAENQELRRAAMSLGDLAERLNQELNAERRRLDPPLLEPTTNS
jgi:predicted RNase H-like nuclease (RuvC/YqgF family)